MSPSISPTMRLGALLLAGAGVVALALPAGAATRHEATAAAVPVTVSVTKTFTDSGLDVQQGASVTIHAAGKVQYRSKHVRMAGPEGIPWGKACQDIAKQASSKPFPAPGLACWSLIGKIGTGGKPFPVGRSARIPTSASGRLFLGINDNYLPDNSGSWVVAVSGAGALPSKSSGGSSSVVPLIALVVFLVLVGLIIWWVMRRRRKPSGPAKPRKPTPAPKPKAEPQPEPAMAAAAAIAASRSSSEPQPAGTPLDPESTDVNIFKVELVQRETLEVGYNFFPEGTTLTWRVAQNGATFASGEFVTEGGGATRHFESIPLGTTVGSGTDSVDVYFSWRIGDVPFGYNVRRDTDA